MTYEVLSFNVGIENACSLWKSIEGQLLPSTKEQEHLLKDRLASFKKGTLSMEEYQCKFKQICNNLAAINAPFSDKDKVFTFARGLESEYKEFRIAMLAKPPFLSFNQFLLALQCHNHFFETEAETSRHGINHTQVYIGERDKEGEFGLSFHFKRKGIYSGSQVQ